MEFFEVLKKDHEQVKEVLQRLMESSERASKSRREGMARLTSLLIPHMMAEEKVFYPAMIEAGQKELGHRAFEEHRAARAVLDDLYKAKPDDERWHARCQVLQELVTHHIEEEESEIFEAAEETFDEQQMQRMLKDFQQQKSQAKKAA